MTIKDYIICLINENYQISKIKITNYYTFVGNNFDANGQQILVEIYTTEDESICEFYNQNNVIVARAKGFVSVT